MAWPVRERPASETTAASSGAGARVTVAERLDHDRDAAVDGLGRQVDRPVRGLDEPADARTGQGLEPVQVGRVDEVPRGAKDVGADELAAVEARLQVGEGDAARHAPGHRPQRHVVQLGLHTGEVADDVAGGGEARCVEPLGVEASGDLRLHGSSMAQPTDR
jgi:hypothetical protein